MAAQLQLALIQPAVQDAMVRAEPQSMLRAEQRRRTDSRAQAEQQVAESQGAQRTELLQRVAERLAAQVAQAPPVSSPRVDAEQQPRDAGA